MEERKRKSSLHSKYGSRYWSGRVGFRSFSPIFSARRCISFVPQSTAPHVQGRATTLQVFQFSTDFVLFVGADLSYRLSADELTISASTKRWLHTPFASIPSRFFCWEWLSVIALAVEWHPQTGQKCAWLPRSVSFNIHFWTVHCRSISFIKLRLNTVVVVFWVGFDIAEVVSRKFYTCSEWRHKLSVLKLPPVWVVFLRPT